MVYVKIQKTNKYICSNSFWGCELLEVEHINRESLKWIVRKLHRLYNFGRENHIPEHLRGMSEYTHYTAKVYVNDIISLRVDYNPLTREVTYTTFPSGKGVKNVHV